MAAAAKPTKPDFIHLRNQKFDELYRAQQDELNSRRKDSISVTLPDGTTKSATSYETTPLQIAESISKSLAEKAVISRVDDQLWDLTRPFEKSCKLQILTFDDDEAKKVYWHSSAHILGEAAELHYGAHLAIGPPIQDGFYYEMGIPKGDAVKKDDYKPIENLVNGIIKQKQKFERLLVTKQDLLEMFKYNKYKQYIISTKIPDGTSTTVYRCGDLIDLCRGPHVPHTGRVKAMMVTKNSSSYWLGDAKNESLQRIYGISFPTKGELSEHKKFLEEAAKRDHRRIAKDQELFFFHELSPGSCFFLPHGARLYERLTDYIKSEYRKRGFTMVHSPNMYSSKLWKTSGHWSKYQEDMFIFDVEKEPWGVKPMNCPGHCLVFGMRERSYRELPLRLAEFGVLHRNEASGALTGLTRVRRFVQDDAHIFCTVDGIEDELMGCLDFLETVYKAFGFTFTLALSTRPEKFLGDVEDWNKAEELLSSALNRYGKAWKTNEADGAFYGPKIDIEVMDALRRKNQCATIQLDFQLPRQFELRFRTEAQESGKAQDSYARPVMIHRAILGSVERMIAILCEHFAGKWPFWLSPRQAVVIPISATSKPYADAVRKRLDDEGFYVDADLSDVTLNKKIRNAEIATYNFVLVVGTEEEEKCGVNVRMRDNPDSKKKGEMWGLEDLVRCMKRLAVEKPVTDVVVLPSA